VARRQAVIDRRRWIYMIEPTRHGMITAWLAGTRIALDEPHPVFAIHLREVRPPERESD